MGAVKTVVIHGANDGLFDLAGARVSAVRYSLADAFNIPLNAFTFVNGEQVDSDFRLKGNECLEFVKQYGEKRGSSFIRYPGGKWNHRRYIIDALKLVRAFNTVSLFLAAAELGWSCLRLVFFRQSGSTTKMLRWPHCRIPLFGSMRLKKMVKGFAPTSEAFDGYKKQLLTSESVRPIQKK